MRQETKYIIIHCSATRPSQDIGFEEINKWHRQKGWNGCGYHFIIKRNGIIEDGRPTDAIGSHCRGYNHNSVGICMVGGVSEDDHTIAEDNFEGDQWSSLKTLVEELHEKYPEAEIKGHYHFNPDKQCPSFDVDDWAKTELLWIEGDYLPGDERDEDEQPGK
jgi:N-acetylmuramoyl-L-alanine amidase